MNLKICCDLFNIITTKLLSIAPMHALNKPFILGFFDHFDHF